MVDGNVVKPVGATPPAHREGKQIMVSNSENPISGDLQPKPSDDAVAPTLPSIALVLGVSASSPLQSSIPVSSSMAIDAAVITEISESQSEAPNSPVLDIVIVNPQNSTVALLSSGSSSPSNRKKKKSKYNSLQSPVTRDILPLEWKNNHHLN